MFSIQSFPIRFLSDFAHKSKLQNGTPGKFPVVAGGKSGKMDTMGMVLERVRSPLVWKRVKLPEPKEDDVLIRVLACGVCRTDLHIVDGELPPHRLPIIPGHEIVGVVEATGSRVTRFSPGMRVGVPWLGKTCQQCRYCRRGQENLCTRAEFTGYTRHGGYAEYVVANARYCFPLPEQEDPLHQAPLLCAGLIGFRAFRMLPASVHRIGIYGFGAAGHILTQILVQMGKEVYAFVRPGDEEGKEFARRMGASWAGASTDPPPYPLDGAIIFAPVGPLVVEALKHVDRGGTVVCGGIYMSDIPAFPYRLLWEERTVRSVANLTREDGVLFFETIRKHPVHTEIQVYPLREASKALDDLRAGRLQGTAVLKVSDG